MTEPRTDTQSEAEEHHDAPPLEPVSPLKRFLHHDMLGSSLLLAAALSALIVANSPLEHRYREFWETPFGFSAGDTGLVKPLHLWVNDGLMAVFFFLVGLEIKRELLVGELASFRKAILPAVAALGGMVFPALVYAIVNYGTETQNGWGIPMATDIAFAAGCIALLKKRVPPALMIFLVALAIVDDLGAVTVIALFYTDSIDVQALALGSCLITLSFFCGRAGIRTTLPYVVLGIMVWVAFLSSGVHATIAGVILAFTIPSDARYRSRLFEGRVRELLQRFTIAEKERVQSLAVSQVGVRAENKLIVSGRQQALIRAMNIECHHVEAPLQRIEFNLEPFCVFVIMPIFAFANSGLTLEFEHIGEYLFEWVTVGVFLGLVLGKQMGIMVAAWISVKLGLASLPKGVNWKQMYAVSWLAGIGFTMSLFIAELAFPVRGVVGGHAHLDQAKIGVFVASFVAGVMGLVLLRVTCPLLGPRGDEGAH